MDVNIDRSRTVGASVGSPDRRHQSVAGLTGTPEARRQPVAGLTLDLEGSFVGFSRPQDLSWAACDCPDDCPRDHEND